MDKYEDLVPLINNKLNVNYGSIGKRSSEYLSRGGFPYGINEAEFNFVKDQIIEHGLRSGFDFATGIGMSVLAMGMGMQATGGTAMSIDCYAEEVFQDLQPKLSVRKVRGGGIKQQEINQQLLELFNLQDIVTLYNGWSPQDCGPMMESVEYIDVVFLDGPKNAASFLETLSYLKPKLADKYLMLVHDTHCFKSDFIHLVRTELNAEAEFKLGTKYPLGVINALN